MTESGQGVIQTVLNRDQLLSLLDDLKTAIKDPLSTDGYITYQFCGVKGPENTRYYNVEYRYLISHLLSTGISVYMWYVPPWELKTYIHEIRQEAAHPQLPEVQRATLLELTDKLEQSVPATLAS